MFRKRTVVVVGAGASVEADLPIGADLKQLISELARFKFSMGKLERGDHYFYDELVRMPEFAGDRRRASHACMKISDGIGYVSSIDSFLEVHASDNDIQLCAKSAITRIITEAEKRSRLNFDRSNIRNALNPNKLQGTWYLELAHMLFEKVDSAQLANAFEPVSFVSFNYDRCLEWFVFNALKGLYFLEDYQAVDLARKLKVYHPYGDVGRPSWLGGNGTVDFGGDVQGRLASLSTRIRTFTEKEPSPEIIGKIREAVADAHTLVFLGFAFHPQNLELLVPQAGGGVSKVGRIFGTAHGMSDTDKSGIEELLQRSFTRKTGKVRGPEVRLVEMKCCEFMRQFKRTLAVQ